MQDNKEHNYEQAFIDHNWAVVREQLDMVKPVAQETPASNWTVRILSILLLLSLVSATFFAYKYKSIIPNAALTKEKVIYQDRFIPLIMHGLEAAEQTTDLYGDSVDDSNNSIISVNENDPQQSTEIMTSLLNNFSERPHESTAITSEDESGNEDRSTAAFDKIDNELLLLETETGEVIIGDDFMPHIKEARRKINYNVGTQIIATHDGDYTGVGFKSDVDFPIGKRIGITTGIAFNYLTREHYFIPGANRTGNTQTHFPKGIAQVTPSSDVYYNGLKTLKQVYLPVSLNYDLSNSFAVNSGVRLRYTYEDDVNSQLPTPQGTSRRTPPEDPSSVFAQTNLGISAGVKYRFNPRFSILLDSEWGVSSLVRNSQLPSLTQKQHDLNLLNLTTSFNF